MRASFVVFLIDMFERAFDAYRSGREEWTVYAKRLVHEVRKEADKLEGPLGGLLNRLADALEECNWVEANELVSRVVELSLKYVTPSSP